MEAVVHEAPLEDALVLLDALLAAQDADLAYQGAGPIEDLMNVHGALLDMPVAERCEQSPKWAEAVWGSLPPDGLEADAKRLRPYLRPDASPADPPAKVRRKKRDDRRREVQVLTDGGVHKAAWMAGDSFSYLHPRTPLRTIVLLWEREPEETPDGIAIVEPEDIQDLMELR